MKIAYVTFEVPSINKGSGRKIHGQACYWQSAGHEVQHFVLSPRPATFQQTGVECQFLVDEIRVNATFSAVQANSRLRKALQAWRPDVVYVRQMLWWPGAVSALGGFPLVMEVNSLSAQEYRHSSRAKYLYYLATQRQFPQACQGIVAVSEEIAASLPAVECPVRVIANGYDFSSAVPKSRAFSQRPQLVFVGSPRQYWNGDDKLVELAGYMPECDFHIVRPGLPGGVSGNVRTYDGLYGADLSRLYASMDVGFSTLALHRKEMEEASPLKSREYLAHGLPVIGAYRDTDFSEDDFFLQLSNEENNLIPSLDRIRDFLQYWRGRRLDVESVRARIDFSTKENQRLAFFAQVLDRKAGLSGSP